MVVAPGYIHSTVDVKITDERWTEDQIKLDQNARDDTKKEPVTLSVSEECTLNLKQEKGEGDTKIRPKIQQRFEVTIKGSRYVVDQIPQVDVIKKREDKIYESRKI